MILIADCGGTKVEWCLLNGDKVEAQFITPGMHALMLTEEEMRQRITDEVIPQIDVHKVSITHVYFYGAGCVSSQVCSSVGNAILANIPDAIVDVASDLLGAARGVCGHNAGIACILGTGSNSCYYDGENIVENISPLGFILGDEGGGAYLGKMLVGDVLKRQLPADLCKKFLDEYQLDAIKIVQRVYREPNPNRFLASLTPFLSANIDNEAIHALVLNAFKAFFRRNVCLYTPAEKPKVNCCGSIAYYFKDVFNEVATSFGFTLGAVIRNPMEGMIAYHSSVKN